MSFSRSKTLKNDQRKSYNNMASLTVPETACNNIMAKETEDDFLAGLTTEEAPVILDEPLFPEETVEKTEKEEEVPFHKNEKVQRYIDKELNKRLKDFKPSAEQTFKEDVLQGEPKFLSSMEKIVGNDTPEKVQMLKDLKEDWGTMSKQAKQTALKEILEAQQEAEQNEQTQIAEAENELEEGRGEIEEHLGKDLTERQWSAYKEFLLDIEPKGGYQEYPDFVKTFEHFKKTVQRSNATAKSLASRGMDRSSTSTTEAPQGTSWKDWDTVKEQILNS